MRPRLIEALAGRITVPADAVVGAGQTSSFCTIVGGQLFAWGKLKPSGARAGWCVWRVGCGPLTLWDFRAALPGARLCHARQIPQVLHA